MWVSDGSCVHHLVASQAAATPAAIAVSHGTREITYRELVGRANACAHLLAGLGAGRGSLVAVALPRSPDALMVLLGVLIAGAAYVPLDPSYPDGRLAMMLDDSDPVVLVTDRALSHRMIARQVVFVDEVGEDLAEPPDVDVRADDLMYVVYTSGSTGGPKGVMLSHGHIVNHLRWTVEAFGLAEGTGAALHSSLAFDLTVPSIYAPLMTGRCVVVPDDSGEPAAALLASARSDTDLSFAKMTPSHLRLLTANGAHRRPDRWAGTLVLGGEDLRAEDLAGWVPGPVARVVNEYGQTETAVACVATAPITGPVATGRVSIGTPIPGFRLYVLDESMTPVPDGVPGEAYISGVGVSYGYWNRPGLTAERFVPDPFGARPGGRLFRTRDLVRTLPTGDLEFIARLDDQVKIRGHRVEPAEVEHALLGLPEVVAAAVTTDDGRLAACLIPRTGAVVRTPEIRAALRRVLPEVMIPSSITVVDRLPLTSNGKVDRAALRSLTGPRPTVSALPATETERVLCELFAEAMAVPAVSTSDDFFQLGGHSLTALRLVASIHQRLGVRLRSSQIFEHPTVVELSKVVDGTAGGETVGEVYPAEIMPAPRRRIQYPAIPVEEEH
jgi:amino acid adenylation domain-containing protein